MPLVKPVETNEFNYIQHNGMISSCAMIDVTGFSHYIRGAVNTRPRNSYLLDLVRAMSDFSKGTAGMGYGIRHSFACWNDGGQVDDGYYDRDRHEAMLRFADMLTTCGWRVTKGGKAAHGGELTYAILHPEERDAFLNGKYAILREKILKLEKKEADAVSKTKTSGRAV